MSDFDSGGEPTRKTFIPDLPGGYCGICGGHSHSADKCHTLKKEVEVPVTSCPCHPSPTSPDPLAQIAESLEKLANPPITFGEALGVPTEQEIEKLRHDAWQEGFRTGHEARLFDTLTPVGEFFEALRDGRVELVLGHMTNGVIESFRVVISPKVGEGK